MGCGGCSGCSEWRRCVVGGVVGVVSAGGGLWGGGVSGGGGGLWGV